MQRGKVFERVTAPHGVRQLIVLNDKEALAVAPAALCGSLVKEIVKPAFGACVRLLWVDSRHFSSQSRPPAFMAAAMTSGGKL